MDRYKKLVSNTFTFAIGTFSSKLLVFFMLPFYTRVMSQESYGVVDLVVQTCNLLIPLATVGITHAIIRFGLERTNDKRSVFSIGVVTVLLGFAVLLLFAPLLNMLAFLQGYVGYLYLFILMSSMQGICSQFARARGYIRFYAVDGVFRTVMTILLNILFLAVLRLDVAGYLLANILTDFLSTLCIIVLTREYRFFSVRHIRSVLLKKMLQYSIPLIPNTICTWVINIFNRYIMAYMLGNGANGLYAIANKIPTILIIVSNIFGDAWQISAFTEEEKGARDHFFSRVAGVYQSVAFVGATLLIAFAKVITRILASPEFYESWRPIPLLVMGTMFACLASFLASVYMVEKRSIYTLITTAVSAAVNVALSFALIPLMGIEGAAFATFMSYFVMFVSRVVHTRKFLNIRWHYGKMLVSFVVICIQCLFMTMELQGWLAVQIAACAVVIVLNMKDLMLTVRKILIR